MSAKRNRGKWSEVDSGKQRREVETNLSETHSADVQTVQTTKTTQGRERNRQPSQDNVKNLSLKTNMHVQ